MKMKIYTKSLCLLFGCLCSLTALADNPQAALGVQISDQPLSALLTKHLKLEEGQGVLVQNVLIDSPADKAGLDKDDLIIKLNGEPLMSYDMLIDTIKNSGIGSKVELTVVQCGVTRDIQVELAAKQTNGRWKYPPALESTHIWRPGRVFKFGPGAQGKWIDPQLPGNLNGLPYGFANVPRIYLYQHRSGEDPFTVTIQGDPEDENALVIVNKNGKVYQVMIGEIDTLPKEFQETVRDDIEKAKKQSMTGFGYGGVPEITIPEFNSEHFPQIEIFKDRQQLPDADLQEKLDQLDRMQKQMDQLQQKLERLEKERRESKESEPQTADHDEIKT